MLHGLFEVTTLVRARKILSAKLMPSLFRPSCTSTPTRTSLGTPVHTQWPKAGEAKAVKGFENTPWIWRDRQRGEPDDGRRRLSLGLPRLLPRGLSRGLRDLTDTFSPVERSALMIATREAGLPVPGQRCSACAASSAATTNTTWPTGRNISRTSTPRLRLVAPQGGDGGNHDYAEVQRVRNAGRRFAGRRRVQFDPAPAARCACSARRCATTRKLTDADRRKQMDALRQQEIDLMRRGIEAYPRYHTVNKSTL